MNRITAAVLPARPGHEGPLAHLLRHPDAAPHAALQALEAAGRRLGVDLDRLAPLLVALTVLGVVGVALLASRRRAEAAAGGRLVTILSPPEVDRDGAVTLWSNLVALLRPPLLRALFGQPHLSFEIRASGAGVQIALFVPHRIAPGLVERAVEAAWPGTRTETGPALPPLPLGLASTGGELRVTRGEHYPLRTDQRVDPLRTVLGALAGIGDGEHACVQVLARPMTGRRVRTLRRAAVARRQGRPSSRFARLLDIVTPGPVSKPSADDPFRAGEVAAIVGKVAEPTWAVSVRYGVATEQGDRAATESIRGRAGALAGAFALFSGQNALERHRLRHVDEVLAARRLGRGSLVSVSELAALAHLPTDVVVPGLARAGAKSVAPPAEVYSAGKVLGDADVGSRRAVALAVRDARYHVHLLGSTGSGKSTLLTRLVLDDVEAGRGVVVIDPKGDLVADLLERMPKGAGSRTVLIDAGDTSAPPVMNVLDATEADHDLVTDNLVGIFRRVFEAYWGPRTDDVMRSSCLTLLRYGSATGTPTSLADIPLLLSDEEFRRPRVAVVADDAVGLGGFWKSYEQMGEAQRAQVIGPVMNKLRAFLMRDFVRLVIGRTDSTFQMANVLDGGICLVRIPKGVIGEETARLLGSFVVAKVWQAATNRARLGQAARRDTALYVDECQNFLNLPRSFDEMLAEARGYGLSLVLAHQYLWQLPRELREAIDSNARTKIFFNLGPGDAHALERHVTPELSEHDLSHLGAYQAAARLVVDGEETPAFTLRTRPAPTAEAGRADAVRKRAAVNGRAGIPPRGPSLPAGDAPERASFERPPASRSTGIAQGIVPGIAEGIVLGIGHANDPQDIHKRPASGLEGGSSPTADSWGDEW